MWKLDKETGEFVEFDPTKECWDPAEGIIETRTLPDGSRLVLRYDPRENPADEFPIKLELHETAGIETLNEDDDLANAKTFMESEFRRLMKAKAQSALQKHIAKTQLPPDPVSAPERAITATRSVLALGDSLKIHALGISIKDQNSDDWRSVTVDAKERKLIGHWLLGGV